MHCHRIPPVFLPRRAREQAACPGIPDPVCYYAIYVNLKVIVNLFMSVNLG
jgi:hypothetical protein